MSLLKTKPRYCPDAVATESGWINPVTKELLVSVGGLKSKLAREEDAKKPLIVVELPVLTEVVEPEIKKEIVMEKEEPKVKNVRGPYKPRKPKVIGEVAENKVPAGQQLIGEVVEYNIDASVSE